jgi:hypothetical protein
MALTMSPIVERKILKKLASSKIANSYKVDFLGLLDESEAVEASQALQTGGSGSFAPLSCRLSF